MNENITNELLQAILIAPDDRKRAALELLHGNDIVPKPQLEPFITLKAVGSALNLHPATLWRWDVPGHDLGGRRRFRLSEVIAYLDSPTFKNRVENLRKDRREQRDQRKEQLLALARDGNAEAVADLFKEFGVEFSIPETDEARHD